MGALESSRSIRHSEQSIRLRVPDRHVVLLILASIGQG